jgi:outer membrane protein assembly factor BamA
MILKFIIYEGVRYRVGAVKFSGNKLFSTAEIVSGLRALHFNANGAKPSSAPTACSDGRGRLLLLPKGMTADTEAVEDYYGAKGYIDVTRRYAQSE